MPETGRFETRAFGKDVLIFSAGNGILLLFGFIQTLIIPKYLSLEGYGYWQIFTLYCSYMGILHLGFINGIYIKWAGKELNQIGNEIAVSFKFLIFEQLAVILPLALITYFLLQPPFQWIGLMILVYAFIMNLAVFFQLTTQAIRQFNFLTVSNVSRGIVFLALIILLFATGYIEYQYIIVVCMASYLLFLIAMTARYRHYLWVNVSAAPSLVAVGKSNINAGILILLGNFVFVIFLTLDRLMVSAFFSIEQFAVYAFAMSVINIAFVLMNAVANVIFPHLAAASPTRMKSAFHLGKVAIILCWAAFLGAYFPLAMLIDLYLPQYTASLPIIKILLGTVGFSSLILILQVNYFLLYRKQRQYFLWSVTGLAIEILLVLTSIQMLGSVESVAIAMLISFFVWHTINMLSLKSVTGESGKKICRGITIMVCYFAAYWLSFSIGGNLIIQLFVYAGIFCLITWALLRNEMRELFIVANKLRK